MHRHNNRLIPQRTQTIDEEPELYTEAELSEAEIGKKLLTKMQDGSLFNTTISLISFSPITLYFIIPCVFANGGFISCLLFLICTMISSYFSLCITLRLKIEKKFTDYHSMIKGFLDNYFYYIYHILYLIFALGYTLFNLMITYNIFSSFLSNRTYIKIILTLTAFLIQLPLTFVTKQHYQRIIKITQFSFILLSLISYILIHTISSKQNDINIDSILSKILFSKTPSNYFITLATFITLTFHHINLFQETSHMKIFTIKRGHTLIKIVTLIETVTILILGIIGTVTQSQQHDTLFFFFSTKENSPLYIAIHLIIIAICLYETAYTVSRIVNVLIRLSNKDKKNIGLYGGLCVGVIAVLNVVVIASELKVDSDKWFVVLLGGIVITVIEYLIPGLLYVKVIKDISREQKIMNIVLMAVMLTIGVGVSIAGGVLLGINK